MSLSSNVPESLQLLLCNILRQVLPQHAGETYVKGAAKDIYSQITANMEGTRLVNSEQLVSKYQSAIMMSDDADSKVKFFHEIINNALSFKSQDQLSHYLMFLDSLKENNGSQSGTFGSQKSGFSSTDSLQNPFLHSHTEGSSDFKATPSFSQRGKSSSQLIQQYYYEYQGVITDVEILENLSYTLLGSQSKAFPFTENGVVKIPSNLNQSIEGFVLLLLEPAILYKHLNDKFNKVKSARNISQMKVAFAVEASNNQLSEYARLVNTLFNQNGITLKTVYSSLYDEIVKLRFLYYLSSLSDKNGPEFISKLYKFTSHGDTLLRSVALPLCAKSMVPYFDMVMEFLLTGENRHDPLKEFFVQDVSTTNLKSISDVVFIAEKVPDFFSAALAESIYQIGKSLVFVRYTCMDLQWLHDMNRKYASYFSECSKGNNNHLFTFDKFTTIVDIQYKEVINYSSFKAYSVFKVIDDIKGVNEVLMKKGDLTYAILNRGFKMLNEPSGTLTSHRLNRLLSEAVDDSSIKNYPREIIDKIDARILNKGSIGFESFTLDYHFSLPLVFEDSIKEYLRLFNFFFKVKRVSYMLNYSWLEATSLKEITSYAKKLKIASRKKKKQQQYDLETGLASDYIYVINHAKKLNIIASNMNKFVNQVLMFFNYEVVEKNFNELMQAFESQQNGNIANGRGQNMEKLAPKAAYLSKINHLAMKIIPDPELLDHGYKDLNIDSIIAYHQDYIKKISRNKLLDTKAASSKGRVSELHFIHQLNNLLSIVFRFLMSNEEYHINILELLNTLNTRHADEEYVTSLKKKLKVLDEHLYDVLYKYQGSLEVFTNDLLNDDDAQLKYFGQLLAGR